jgi:hypothetical protein
MAWGSKLGVLGHGRGATAGAQNGHDRGAKHALRPGAATRCAPVVLRASSVLKPVGRDQGPVVHDPGTGRVPGPGRGPSKAWRGG